jgi:hypothetical protein
LAWADRAALLVERPFLIQGTTMIRSLLIDSHKDAWRRSLVRFLPLVLLIAALASLAACGSTVANVPTATSAPTGPTATSVPAGTVLFQSDWSKGLDGWQASDGWTVRGGLLEMDGQDNRTLTIPYQPAVRDYAVEFQVQVVYEPKDGGYFWVHATPTPQAAGYRAGVFGLLTTTPHFNGDHPTAEVMLDPIEAQTIASQHPTDYEPHSVMWTYHVEVRDNSVQFRRDTASLSAAVAIKEGPLSQGPLKIECGLASLRFGQIRITAL